MHIRKKLGPSKVAPRLVLFCAFSLVACAKAVAPGAGTAGNPLSAAAPSLADPYVGKAYHATLTASGGTAPYSWTVAAGALPTGLGLSAAGELAGTPTTTGAYSFTLAVKDSASGAAQVPAGFTVYAVPAFSSPTLPDAYAGSAYSGSVAAQGGKSPLSFALATGSSLPGGLTLGSQGKISGTAPSPASASFSVTLTDAGGAAATQAFQLTIIAALAIDSAALPDAYAGAPFSHQLAASGGLPPYLFSPVELPPGLSLGASGELSGTPDAASDALVQVKVADSNGITAQASLPLAVRAGVSIRTATPLPDAYTDRAYAFAFSAAGGLAPYLFSLVSGALPAGLSLDPGGAVTGMPGSSGAAIFTVQATDAAGGKATWATGVGTFAPPTFSTTALADAYQDTPYSAALAASGGHAPLAFSLAPGSVLPAGLAINSSGALAGTPVASGPFALTCVVTDASGRATTQPLSLRVFGSLSVGNAFFADAYTGLSYGPFALQAVGGLAPFTWSIAGGALPSSIGISSPAQTLSSSGAVSDSAGIYGFTLQLRDANNITVASTQALHVYSQPSVANATASDAYLGVAYSDSLHAAGGKAPLTWAVASGAPPAWLTIAASSALSGTPDAPGAATFTARATDANGISASGVISFNAYALPAVTTAAMPVGTDGSLYSPLQLQSSGGKPPIGWTSSGSLPSGLSISGAGVVSGTPAGPGTYAITVTAQDANGKTGSRALSLSILPGPGDASNTPQPSTNGAIAIDFSAGLKNVYVAWSEASSFAGARLFFTRSTDGGKTFATSFDLGPEQGSSAAMAGVRTSDGAVVVMEVSRAYYQVGAGGLYSCDSDVQLWSSADHGQTFATKHFNAPSGLTTLRTFNWDPAFSQLDVVSGCNNLGTSAITYSRSQDLGSTWSPGITLTASGGLARGRAFVSQDGSNVYVAWVEAVSNPNRADVYLVRSTDGGATFSPYQTAPNLSAALSDSSDFPVVRANGTSVAVIWTTPSGTWLALSTNSGQTFAAPVAADPRAASAQPTPDGALVDLTVRKGDVTCYVSHDSGVTFSAPANLTNSPNVGKSVNFIPGRALARGAAGDSWVAWAESGGNQDIFVREYPTQCQ